MALLLLKMNNLNAASAVLSKANRFNAQLSNQMQTANLQLDTTVKQTTAEHDIDLEIKNDQSQLVFHETSENKLKSKFKRESLYKHEDASVMEAQFSFFFISGLYE